MTPGLDFIVLGLPRSGTTWCANWLTTDRSLCLHDPFNELPEHWPRDYRRFGISCTGAYLMPDWLAQQRCPVVVIERERADCEASTDAIGLAGDLSGHAAKLAAIPGRRVAFNDLWDERAAESLWGFLLPDLPFDAIRYRLLRQMQVQPHQFQFNHHAAAELLARGYFRST